MTNPANSAPTPTSLAQTLPQFAPVPRAKDRHNGWKPEVQLAFILRQAQDDRG